MSPPIDLAHSLCSIESIKIFLAGLVTATFGDRKGQPVRLTFIGGEFARRVGVPFEKHLNGLADREQITLPQSKRKLAPFVQNFCDDILTVSEHSPGVYFVSPLVAGAEQKSSQTPSTLRFHRAVWAAFIRPLEGKRRFLNLNQIGFTDCAEKPALGEWLEIEERFVLGAPSDAQVDGAEIQRQIEEWAKFTGAQLSKLVMSTQLPREHIRAGVFGHLEQLLAIIDALPAPVAGNWSIPATVLKHLRGAR